MNGAFGRRFFFGSHAAEIYEASVSLMVRAMVVSARWAARSRRLGLERVCARAEAGRVAKLEARILVLEDAVAFRDARLEVMEKRLGEERPRRSYPLVERLRLLWLMEYYQISKRRVKDSFGVAHSTVHRWLKGFQEGRLGGRREGTEPPNNTPREIVARYPNHVWSVDRTRVMRWGIWPTWVVVAIDHFSRAVTAVVPLEGPNAGWVAEALEKAFLRHGPPKHLISDQEAVFTGEAFAELLAAWNVKQRFGAVGRHGSIAVTERLIWTLKREWLARVALVRGLDHLGQLLPDFEVYYNEHRLHQRLGGATPATVYRGQTWKKPDRSAKRVTGPIRLRHFREQRITLYELAA